MNELQPWQHRHEAFDKLVADTPWSVAEPVDDDVIMLPDGEPSTVARSFEERSVVSHHHNSIDGYSIYHNDQYQKIKDEKELDKHIRIHLGKCMYQVETKKSSKDMCVRQTTSMVNDVRMWLSCLKSVHIPPSKKAPYDFSGKLNPATTVALKNGLLDYSNPMDIKLLPFTKDFYTFNYIPVAYNPDAVCDRWCNECLGYYFANEDGTADIIARDTVHSWYKRFLFSITTPHRIFAIIGDPRSGKSTIGRIASRLVGRTNTTAISIASLSGPHGLYSLMNKQLGVMWDTKVTGRAGDVARAVEVLKTISGQDDVQVNPKGRDMIDLPSMPMSILMLANKIADLKDSTGALASRFNFLETTQSFLGHEDPSLEQHVVDHELSGILNLVLAAPETIIEHPHSESMTTDFLTMSSPYNAFAQECCVIGDPKSMVPCDVLWLYYLVWANNYHQKIPSNQTFKVGFKSAVRGVTKHRASTYNSAVNAVILEDYRVDRIADKLDRSGFQLGTRPSYFKGVNISPETVEVFSA